VVTPDKTVNQRNVKTGVQDGDKIQVLPASRRAIPWWGLCGPAVRRADVGFLILSKITAPSGAGEAARAAAAPRWRRLSTSPVARTKKLCPPRSRHGEMRVFEPDDLSADCLAMSQCAAAGRWAPWRRWRP
jgi:hypothetical protein